MEPEGSLPRLEVPTTCHNQKNNSIYKTEKITTLSERKKKKKINHSQTIPY
jgi:hypothetical protein